MFVLFLKEQKKVLHYQIWRKGQQDGAILTIGIKQRGICLSGFLFDVELGKGSIIETRIASQGEMNEKCSCKLSFPGGSVVKNTAALQEM